MCEDKCEWRGMLGTQGMPGRHCGKPPTCRRTNTLTSRLHIKTKCRLFLKQAEEKGRVLTNTDGFHKILRLLTGDMGAGYLSGGEKTSAVSVLAPPGGVSLH